VASVSNDPILDWILTEGKATQITRISPVGGGCFNRASRYDADSGSLSKEIGDATTIFIYYD
jgi:protein-ribulosamine 3-kinase